MIAQAWEPVWSPPSGLTSSPLRIASLGSQVISNCAKTGRWSLIFIFCPISSSAPTTASYETFSMPSPKTKFMEFGESILVYFKEKNWNKHKCWHNFGHFGVKFIFSFTPKTKFQVFWINDFGRREKSEFLAKIVWWNFEKMVEIGTIFMVLNKKSLKLARIFCFK